MCKYLGQNYILKLLEVINEYVFMRRMMVERENLPKFKKFVFEPIEKHYYQKHKYLIMLQQMI